MGKLILLADGEDLVATFRPHWASRLARYVQDALWLLYGALAAAYGLLQVEPAGLGLGLFAFALLATLHTAASLAAHRGGWLWGLVWASAAALGGVLVMVGWLPSASDGVLAGSLGAVATLLLWIRTDLVRRRHQYFLTDRRLVIRSGIERRTERTLELERIESVQGHQGPLGQVFGYGTLTLVPVPRGRSKKEATDPVEVLAGVRAYLESKHRLETLSADARLPARERAKRAEERRLKASLEAVASWVHKAPK